MLRKVIPELSCPIALFTYYNPILKRGIDNFMSIIKDAGVHGLVVPDVPLEETEILRREAAKNNIELVLLTTPTTPTARMKAIVEASEGFVYLVSSVGVTGARTSVSDKVQMLLKDIKEATAKPVAVGFGMSKPEHVAQVAGWGADGVIVGSAMVRILADAKSLEEGLKELEFFAKSPSSPATKSLTLERLLLYRNFTEESFNYSKKLLERSALGEATYMAEGLHKSRAHFIPLTIENDR